MSSKATFAQLVFYVVLAAGQVLGTPVITDFSPTAGGPGDQVLLTGSGFLSGNLTVRFGNPPGNVVATIVFVNSDTLMTISVPSGVTTGPISIQQGTGSQSYTPNDFLAVGSGPYLSGFSPLYGVVNDTVIVTGVHLGSVTSVLFHGTSATEATPNASGTQITTRVPAGATSGPLTVITSNGTSNTVTSFTVVGPGPFITDFSPVSGDSGTTVLIDGLHFTGLTNVTFNGQPGTNLVSTSDRLIQIQAPVGVTTGPIAVYTTLGSSVTSSNFFAKPTITGFSPGTGRVGTNVVITGTNLLGATAVLFNGTPAATFIATNNNSLTATVPASATTGLIRVIVPGGSAFSAMNFVIRPTLSGFSPTFGPVGTAVTITGANLNASTPIVRFNGVQAATPTGVMFGQLTAQVPAGASTGPISVTTVDGSDTNAFIFFLPATITGFTPTNSPPGSRVTITGQNFGDASAVTFNGAPAAGFTTTNNVAIGATVPDGVITGPISVTTPAGAVISTNLFYGAPVITAFTPTHGLPGTNVTINGVNLLGGKVLFNGLGAVIVSLNNTQIVASVPGGAKTGSIAVAGPAATNTSVGRFTLDYTSDLQVWMTNSPNPVAVGSSLLYTITIVNNGPYPAPNATLTNTLPATAKLRAASISAPWVLTTNGNVLTGSAASLGVGSATTFTISVTPQLAGSVTDTITVASDNPDPVPSNNTASITTSVLPAALLSISLLTNQVMISWPVAVTNYGLQFQDSLSTNAPWSSVTNTPSISGNLQFVIEPTTDSNRFYRLQKSVR